VLGVDCGIYAMIFVLVISVAIFFFLAGFNRSFSTRDLLGDLVIILPAFVVNTLYSAIFLRAGIIGALALDYHGAARVSAALIYGYSASVVLLVVKNFLCQKVKQKEVELDG
jgi:hypothetical protein